MSRNLKGIIIGLADVIVRSGTFDTNLFPEIKKLIDFVRSKGVVPVILANREWHLTDLAGKQSPLQPGLTRLWGDFPWYVANRDGTPRKPSAEAVGQVLSRHGWDPAEVVYIGNSVDDMRTAVNGNVLFLNATWYGNNTEYGFKFGTPVEIAKFIDTFCLRSHHWHFAIEQPPVAFYALAPFSTHYAEFAAYSSDARAAAKQWGGGHLDFWNKYIIATLYFSEIYKQVDYVACYPGHAQGSGNPIMEDPMLLFTKCFRKTHLRDLIVRHTDAQKSATTRAAGGRVDHLNQLNTISLRRDPLKGSGTGRYKSPPLTNGKTVLVVDDICTRGYSLEAARVFVEQTGAKVIGLSWLKTINTPYEPIVSLPVAKFDPYQPQRFAGVQKAEIQYSSGVRDRLAPAELTHKLRVYDAWTWPTP